MKEYKGLSDEKLIERVKSGDNAAFAEIIRRNEILIANTVKGMLGDTAEAEDVGQEVFIRFYKSINFFKGESKLSTYLARIAINLSLNELKKRKRKGDFFKEEINEEKLSDVSDETRMEERTDLSDAINRALGNLESPFRAVVVLRLVDGYSTKEAAEILGLPIGTILSRLARAQKKLRKELEYLIT